MTYLRRLGFTLLTISAFGAFATPSAWAENPEILPNPTAAQPLVFTSSIGKIELVSKGGKVIECTKGVNAGEFTSARLGVVTIHYETCKEVTSNMRCNTTGAVPGELTLANVDIHLVDFKKEAMLTLGVVLNFPEVVITCGTLKVKVVAKNGVLGTVDEVTSGVVTNKAKLLFHQSKGAQEFKECELDKAFCEKKEFTLETNFGIVEQAGLFLEDNVGFAKNISIVF